MTRRGFVTAVVLHKCTRSPLTTGSQYQPNTVEPPPPPPPPPPPSSIVYGLLGTGQSLSVGARGLPVINPITRYNNLKVEFNYSDIPWISNHRLIPAGEPVRHASTGPYPYNCYEGENSPITAMADQITKCSVDAGDGDYVTIEDNAGSDGYTYDLIKKGGGAVNYAMSVDAVTDAHSLATAAGKSYVFGAMFHNHGESDFGDATYDAKVIQLVDDYNADVAAITGQATRFPAIAAQASAGYPAYVGGRPTAAWRTWVASVSAPTKVVCAGPKYQYAYYTDNIHLTSPSYQRLGIKGGQVYDAVVRRGVSWRPLEPLTATRSGAVITLTLHVPVGPMQFDTSIAVEHVGAWASGRGFEVVDSTGNLTISSVTIASPTTIAITLSATPTGTGLTLSYAMELAIAGHLRGGQVCDSDPFVGFDQVAVNCSVTSGSEQITPLTDFAHGTRDHAEASSLASGTLITAWDGTNATLSTPWTGATGTSAISFRSDQKNYLVQFQMAVT